jgi:hypothetical protein
MPGGTQSQTGSQAGTGSTSTTVQAPQAVNPYLQSIYNQIFGGAAPGATQTLQDVQSGKQLSSNISQIYGTLQQAGQTQYQQGLAGIKAMGGASGTRFSTDTGAQTSQYAQNYISQLNQTATQMGLSEEGTQVSAAEGVLSPFAQGANQFYSPGTKVSTGYTGTGSSSTSMPWTTGVTAIASLFS